MKLIVSLGDGRDLAAGILRMPERNKIPVFTWFIDVELLARQARGAYGQDDGLA